MYSTEMGKRAEKIGRQGRIEEIGRGGWREGGREGGRKGGREEGREGGGDEGKREGMEGLRQGRR
jgi:hypothetical protein